MHTAALSGSIESVAAIDDDDDTVALQRPAGLAWTQLPRIAQAYVLVVAVAGAYALAYAFPRTFPEPFLFLGLLTAACLTSIWKVTLPLPLTSGSTLSVSYAADLMALLLLGPKPAVAIAVAGVLAQCTIKVKAPYPPYRTLFSMAGEALAMTATGAVYTILGGPVVPVGFALLAKPLVGAIATYFIVNTGLVAGAIAASSGRSWWSVWRVEFLWSSASFMVAGTAGAAAAVVIARGEHWKAVLLLAPVYLTYRTYQVFVGRLEDQKRHTAETRRLHQASVEALQSARLAEAALAGEKRRLAATVAELSRLEQAQKQMIAREQAARASAEDASRLKDQFLAMVSHELRTPLNAVVGWSDMLRSGKLPAGDRDKATEAIYSNARRQARMIDELLDVARITSGKLRLERSAVNLEQVVRDALDVVQVAAESKGVHIDAALESAVGTIYGDGGRLQQIAWNLLSNAVKFTPSGGHVRLEVRRVDNIAELTVSDDGVGIPPEFLPHMFEPFTQADGSTRRAYGGLGLGLSIVRQLVEAHGGSVSAHSDGEGLGTTFTVQLPMISLQAQQIVRSPVFAAHVAAASLEGLSVLVVDDDQENREAVAANLATERIRVLTASSAAEALELLSGEHVDVMLADIAMPGEDGYSLVRKVRSMKGPASKTPAAALTALARDEDRQHSLDAGFQLHLAKPIDSKSLIAAVAGLAALRKTNTHGPAYAGDRATLGC
jgi:signal transduction histidine kinase/ActR/RegA family two-component response regulator